MVDFGKRIKILRTRDGLTQQQLAQRLGITKSCVSAYENDLRLPPYDTLISIARIFNTTTDYLLGLEHYQEIDFSGLTDEEISALNRLIKIMKQRGNTNTEKERLIDHNEF